MHKLPILLSLVLLVACGRQVQETQPIRKTVTETVFASGSLEASEIYHLTARTDGYLTSFSIEENDYVQSGQIVAMVNNEKNRIRAASEQALYEIAQQEMADTAPQLAQAQNDMQQAKQNLDYERQQLKRYEKLWQANSIARVEYEQVQLQFDNAQLTYENSKRQYDHLKQQARKNLLVQQQQKNIAATSDEFNTIMAVQAGQVLRKYKYVGDYVQPGEVIALIGDVSTIYAEINIDDRSITKVKPGQEVVIQLNVDEQNTYAGVVREILPAFDESTQSFTAKVDFLDSLAFRYVGTQLQANIIVDSTENALLIPRNYLSYGNEVTLKGQAQPTKVATKIISTDWVQVLSGLDEQATIVTENIQ
ncbi:MAG: HlyD family efflux transporter periplasmic adaptor subunit [Bacteroidota bacterium]